MTGGAPPAAASSTTEHQLDPRTRLRFRPVRPPDRSRFEAAFAQLSDESRYCRCFAFRDELTPGELDMLCDVDGTSHVALVVASLDERGQENESVGGARFIRSDDVSDTAEMAFLIVDGWQGRHVGGLLLQRLMELARQQRVRSLRCHLLPGNAKARWLLRSVSRHTGWKLTFDEEGAVLDDTAVSAHARVA